MTEHDQTQDPGHGEPDHVHDENWQGGAELGMVLGGLPPSVTGTGSGAGEAVSTDVDDHADDTDPTAPETGGR